MKFLILLSLIVVVACQPEFEVKSNDGYGVQIQFESSEDELDSTLVIAVDSQVDGCSHENSSESDEDDDIGLGDELGLDVDMDTVIDRIFDNFRAKYSKNFDNFADSSSAKQNVRDNLEKVRAHNAKRAADEVDFSMSLYKFHDLPIEEALQYLCGTKLPPTTRALSPTPYSKPESYPEGPDAVNFTEYCLPVAEQGYCSSCWSFAAVAQVETLFKRNTSAYNTPLSQQYLVDCDEVNGGCRGGWPRSALEYLRDNGIVKNRTYPYVGKTDTCEKKHKLGQIPKLGNVVQFNLKGNETLLKNIVATEGPVAVAVHASEKFLGYKSGIFSDPDCATSCGKITHGVLVTGYGTDNETGKDFWILRNSYGDDWGENGYMRIARNQENNCLTACYAMFAQLA